MSFKKIQLLCLFLGLISLLGCDLTWRRYSNKEYGFSLNLPRRWQMRQGVNDTVVQASAPQKANEKFAANVNVVVSELPERISLEEFFELNKEETLRLLPGEKLGIQEGDIFAFGRRGMFLNFTTVVKDFSVRFFSAVWIKGKRVYVITASCEDKFYPEYEPAFKKILRSFRF